MIDVTDEDEFTAPVQVPSDAHPANAASVRHFAQQLSNRTRHQKNRVDALLVNLGQITLPTSTAQLRYLSARSAGPGGSLLPFDTSWMLITGGYRSLVNSARMYWDMTPHLKRHERIDHVYVAVDPGAARFTTGNRVKIELVRANYGPGPWVLTPSLTVVGDAVDDGTPNPQWIHIDLTGTPVMVAEGATWELNLKAGNDAETNADVVYAVMYQTSTDRIG